MIAKLILGAGLLISLTLGASAAYGQGVPWDEYADPATEQVCGIVNVDNGELVILSSTGELVLVSATDRILSNTFVDDDLNVFFEGDPVGVIDFAEDDDGFPTLWWMSLTGRVVEIDEFTGEPFVTDNFPSDYIGECDPCDFLWDDESDCFDTTPPIDPPPISISICGGGSSFSVATAGLGLALMALRRRRLI